MGERRAGENQPEESTPDGLGWTALEVVITLWAVGLMGYYYYVKGYPDLLAQIWRLFFA